MSESFKQRRKDQALGLATVICSGNKLLLSSFKFDESESQNYRIQFSDTSLMEDALKLALGDYSGFDLNDDELKQLTPRPKAQKLKEFIFPGSVWFAVGEKALDGFLKHENDIEIELVAVEGMELSKEVLLEEGDELAILKEENHTYLEKLNFSYEKNESFITIKKKFILGKKGEKLTKEKALFLQEFKIKTECYNLKPIENFFFFDQVLEKSMINLKKEDIFKAITDSLSIPRALSFKLGYPNKLNKEKFFITGMRMMLGVVFCISELGEENFDSDLVTSFFKDIFTTEEQLKIKEAGEELAKKEEELKIQNEQQAQNEQQSATDQINNNEAGDELLNATMIENEN